MGQRKRKQEPQGAPGAPEWMVTFSDCMTLLLTFFVLLLSFSSFDIKDIQQLSNSFRMHMSSISTKKDIEITGIVPRKIPIEEVKEGSENPTSIEAKYSSKRKEIETEDFHYYKVYMWPSDMIFFSRGQALTSKGKEILQTMALFLEKMPGRIVISENGPSISQDSKQLGFDRAATIIKYLTIQRGLAEKRFSISQTSTVPQKYFENRDQSHIDYSKKRSLEIIFVDRSLYD